MSTHNLGFHILGFYHRVQWRGAKTAGSECWGPCHGLIPSLWDFAQNCSLQTERWNRNCSGTFHWAMHFGSHGLPKLIEAFPQKQVFFCPCASNGEDSPKASPRAIFKWKRLIEPLKLLSQWMKCGESWMSTCANMCHYAPRWANIAVCQLCRERQPLWNSHDGLKCLDQCHDVRSHGTSSSRSWRKRIFVQSKFDPWV